MQLDIFSQMYPSFKFTKPIALIELFGGYGSQALALKYLGVNFKHHKLCEWNYKSFQAYKDIHIEDDADYSKDLKTEDIKQYLFDKGISSNWNEPMTKDQVFRLNEKQARTIYNNIKSTHNLVNIQQVKGEDLEITEKDKYQYLMTYSFPCQDLSLAGNQKGMSDTSTRSGMLWEVERILKECKELNQLPDCLLMENVPMVHSKDNVKDFTKWINSLEELGYKNYYKDIIATDYGIPQTRNRCFMVSVLGDYSYTFPKPIPLKLKLKDMLEEDVSEKYYLSDAMKQYIFSEDDKYIVNKNSLKLNRDIACSKTTREGQTRADTSDYIAIKNNTKKGYLEGNEGDGIDISSRMEHHRGTIQKNKSQTITTMGGENVGVIVKDLKIRKLTPRECFRLMGVKDDEFNKIKQLSDSVLYHLAGDSIVCDGVLTSIFKNMT